MASDAAAAYLSDDDLLEVVRRDPASGRTRQLATARGPGHDVSDAGVTGLGIRR